MTLVRRCLGTVLLIGAWACGDAGQPPTPPPRLDAPRTSRSAAEAGDTVRASVLVLRGSGRDPFIGAVVSAVADGGGSVAPASALTNSEGRADFLWTLGLVTGAQRLTFTTPGAATSQVAEVQATTVLPDRLTISGSLAPLEDSDTRDLSAALVGRSGQSVSGAIVAWRSLAPSLASVAGLDARGTTARVTAISRGTARIEAESQGKRDTVEIAIVATAVASIEVLPLGTVRLSPGWTAIVTGIPRNARGGAMSVVPDDVSSSAPRIATVSTNGQSAIITGGDTAGTASVTFRYGNLVASRALEVAPAPVVSVVIDSASLRLEELEELAVGVTLWDEKQFRLRDRACTTTSSNPSVATARWSGAALVATGVAAGTTSMSVTCEGVAAIRPMVVSVTRDVVASVSVVPVGTWRRDSVEVGDTVAVRVEARTATGDLVRGRAVTWSYAGALSGAGAGDTVTLIASTIGAGEVQASVERTSSHPFALSVLAPVPRTTELRLTAGDSVVVGGSMFVEASQRDKRGRPIANDVSPATWTSSDVTVLSVSGEPASNGRMARMTGVAVGAATIMTTMRGIASAPARLRVVAAAVDSIALQLPSPIQVGSTVTANALLFDRTGKALVGRPVSWSSSNPSVATVPSSTSSSVVVTSVAVGSTTISARAGAASASRTLVVEAPPAASINIRIAAVVQPGTNTPAPLNDLRDSVEVLVEVTAPTVADRPSELRTRIGGSMLGTQPAPSSCAPTCSVRVLTRTHAWDGVTRRPLRLNGQNLPLVAESVTPSGIRTSAALNVALNNPDGFVAVVTSVPAASATSATGELWHAGSVSADLYPVFYSGQIAASIMARFGNGPVVAALPPASGTAWRVTFPNPGYTSAGGALEGISLAPGSAYDGGGAPPLHFVRGGAPTVALRLDNAGPTGSFVLPAPALATRWLGTSFDAASNVTIADVGVGVAPTPVVFEWSGCASSAWTVFSGRTGSAAGALPECATDLTNAAYTLRARAVDRLGNGTIVSLSGSVGVDVTPPSLTYTGTLSDGEIYNVSFSFPPRGPHFDLNIADSRSGVPSDGSTVQRSLVHFGGPLDPGLKCVVGVGTPGAQPFSNPGCGFAVGPAAVNFPGYATGVFGGTALYRAIVADLAGNAAPTVQVRASIDFGNPFVGPVAAPSLAVGEKQKFAVAIGDDNEISEAALLINYPGVAALVYHETWMGFPAPSDTAESATASPTAQFSTPFDDAIFATLPAIRPPFYPFTFWMEPTDTLGAVQPQSAYSSGSADLVGARASDYLGKYGLDLSTALPPQSGTVSWFDYNAQNPTKRVISFTGSYIAQGARGWPELVGRVVMPSTADAGDLLRVDWYVHMRWEDYGAPFWCYLDSSTTFQLVATTVTTKTFESYVGRTSTRKPQRRSCISGGTIFLDNGVQMYVLPVLVRRSAFAEGLATSPFTIF